MPTSASLTHPAAEKFIAAAEAAGFTVTVERTVNSIDVFIKSERSNASLNWSVVNVQANCRLGFPIGYTPGVRFQDATVFHVGDYHVAKSAKQVALILGIVRSQKENG